MADGDILRSRWNVGKTGLERCWDIWCFFGGFLVGQG